jgi:hypothetical protein
MLKTKKKIKNETENFCCDKNLGRTSLPFALASWTVPHRKSSFRAG